MTDYDDSDDGDSSDSSYSKVDFYEGESGTNRMAIVDKSFARAIHLLSVLTSISANVFIAVIVITPIVTVVPYHAYTRRIDPLSYYNSNRGQRFYILGLPLVMVTDCCCQKYGVKCITLTYCSIYERTYRLS